MLFTGSSGVGGFVAAMRLRRRVLYLCLGFFIGGWLLLLVSLVPGLALIVDVAGVTSPPSSSICIAAVTALAASEAQWVVGSVGLVVGWSEMGCCVDL